MKKRFLLATLLFSITTPCTINAYFGNQNTTSSERSLFASNRQHSAQNPKKVKEAKLFQRFVACFLNGIVLTVASRVVASFIPNKSDAQTAVNNLKKKLQENLKEVSEGTEALDFRLVNQFLLLSLEIHFGNPIHATISYILFSFLEVFSPGKYVLGLKIVDVSGKEATFGQLLLRAICKFPPFFLLIFLKKYVWYVALLLAWNLIMVISVLASDDGRGIPDKIAGTVVIKQENVSISNDGDAQEVLHPQVVPSPQR